MTRPASALHHAGSPAFRHTMLTSLAGRVWRRGPHSANPGATSSNGGAPGHRSQPAARSPHAHAKFTHASYPTLRRATPCTVFLCLAAVALVGLTWAWAGRTAGPNPEPSRDPGAQGPATVLRGGTHGTQARPARDPTRPQHVPRSVRDGAPPFRAQWTGLPDYAATGLELPPLATRVVSAWGTAAEIAQAAAAARAQAAASGGAGAGVGWDVPPGAHAEADADVTVVVSPKDLFNITRQVRVCHAAARCRAGMLHGAGLPQPMAFAVHGCGCPQGMATLAASAFWRSVRFLYCVPLMALPDAARASTIALADTLPNVQLVSYPLAYGDTHAMRRFVAPLVPTRFALFVMNDISVLRPSPWWQDTHAFMVARRGMVMGVNVGEEYGGKVLGAHPSAAEVVVVRDAGEVPDPAAAPDLYVHMHFNAEEHAEAFREAGGQQPVRTAYMEDHAVYLETG